MMHIRRLSTLTLSVSSLDSQDSNTAKIGLYTSEIDNVFRLKAMHRLRLCNYNPNCWCTYNPNSNLNRKCWSVYSNPNCREYRQIKFMHYYGAYPDGMLINSYRYCL